MARKLTLEEVESIKLYKSVNERKNAIQELVIKEWLITKRGCLQAFTGFGKSIIVAKVVKLLNQQNPDATTCIVVPSLDLKDDFIKTVETYDLKNVEVHVINSLSMKVVKENLDKYYDFFVADELHTLCNQNSMYFSELIPRIRCKLFLGLTATLAREHISYLKKFNLEVFFDIPMEDGYRCDVIPSYEIYNIGVDFNFEESMQYIKVQKEYESIVKQFTAVNLERPIDAINVCLGEGKSKIKYQGVERFPKEHAAIFGQIMDMEAGKVIYRAKLWKKLVGDRARLLGSSKASIQMAMNVAAYINKPALIVCANIPIAETMKEYLPESLTFHSKLPKKTQNKNKGLFTKGGIKFLLVAKGLMMGYDKTDLEVLIRQGYDSKSRTLIQYTGRVVRFDPKNPKKTAIIVNIYVKDVMFKKVEYKSQQKVWLQNALYGMNFVNWIDNINEIDI